MDYLKRGVMPFADNDKNYPYHESEEPQTKEQLWAKLVEQNKKLSPDDPDARRKLYHHCCMFGTARDAVDLFEEIQGVPMLTPPIGTQSPAISIWANGRSAPDSGAVGNIAAVGSCRADAGASHVLF